ncbi:uncharacterized protein GGS22DRAFT_161621 [Annulohypoxylon maeteangense]|uniref:uncharacterized protein n=1 Tax=Annulohypoxylon maeteangense TaxID=1927788 RepID=UPI00200727FB|nr:uncharacterized protein GGS22DRAFT_161621 [Annulohypoxylon maeteangense]KAI0885684.1 hypothetical protein GGS22DRAFT_161621 [Annulohypoxylon maeteangense]
MASSSTATPETLITLKVNFDGVTRRFKLPLRELVVSTLEGKLRSSLHIPAETTAAFERYSDSAGSFVLLHPTNISAYKQLYRAAKAKQKLKLRVTTQLPECVPMAEVEAVLEPEVEQDAEPAREPEEVKAPKPVTIEDEPEIEPKEVVHVEPAAQEPSPVLACDVLAETRVDFATEVLDSISVSDIHSNLPDFVELWRKHDMPSLHVRRDEEGNEFVDLIKPAPAVTAEPLGAIESSEGTQTSPDDTSRCHFSPQITTNEAIHFLQSLQQRLSASREHTAEQGSPESYYRSTEAKEAQPEEAKVEEPRMEETTASPSCPKRPFAVFCNSCDRAVPDAHFHCSTCDDGDFDLCQDCVNQGITCYGDGHWLIKRTIQDGRINYSSTHVAPKIPRPQSGRITAPSLKLPIRPAESAHLSPAWNASFNDRTCNCCVQDFPGEDFLHCTTCDDYDLCKNCFAKNKHGHHPGHGFVPVVKGTVFEHSVSSRLPPGRNTTHNAICDGCDKYVRGIRHKCLDCPDWDYCSECVQNAGFIHANHRFVAIYEPLTDRAMQSVSRTTHLGICCDGPLCAATRGSPSKYIVGVRYKCAVCNDTDFCSNCEASPSNTHNKTHPLIKFKTPVRHVSVTTTGEHENGQRMPAMGDRTTRATATDASIHESIAATPVQTVVDVQPTEQQLPKSEEKEEAEVEVKEEVVDPEVATLVEKQSTTPDLVAVFQHDRVPDGTILPPNHTFEQVWVLRNEGTDAWPAGCSVKFVGGDYMGAVDPAHPAGIHELVSASESTICYNALSPGQEFPFTVLMRTPDREGKVISYWRLTTPDGVKFGHKLWCDVTVQALPKVVEAQPLPKQEEASSSSAPDLAKSQMIIPKLEHESPSASMHEIARSEREMETETETLAQSVQEEEEDFEDCDEDEEWAESDEGFMTDEEYDILDASDEEYLSENHKPASKK